MIVAVLILCLGGPEPPFLEHRCDVIELNVVYAIEHDTDVPGRRLLDMRLVQFLFWDWSPARKAYICQGYTIEGRCSVEPHGRGAVVWCRIGPRLVRVIGTSYRETCTPYDPERLDQQRHHPSLRRISGFAWVD